MVKAEIKLYHGTSVDRVGGAVLRGKQPLIGKRILNDPGWSGTLTDDKEYAARWAHRRGGDPIIMTYILPKPIVIDEGVIGMREFVHGFSTNLEISLDKLPKAYLIALFNINLLDSETLEIMVKKGQIKFHTVPFKYFVGFEDV